MPYDRTNPFVQVRGGTPYVWNPKAPTGEPVDPFADQGVLNDAVDRQLGRSGTPEGGTWEQASYANESGLSPWKALGMLAGAGTPAGLLSFASVMHPEGKVGSGLRYAAMGAGVADALSGFHGFGGAGAVPRALPVASGLPSALAPTAATTAAAGVGAGAATAAGGGGMSLGNILSTVGKFIGGGGGGGKVGNVPLGDIFEIVGRGAGAINQGREAHRTAADTDAAAIDQEERLRQQAMINALLADVRQREYSDTRYTDATNQRIRGNAMQGAQDFHVTRPGTVPTVSMSGGLRPSMVGHAGEIGSELETEMARRMQHPDPLPALPTLDAPTPREQPGGLDSLLEWIHYGGGGGALLDDLLKNRPKTPAATAAPPPTLPTIPGTQPPPAPRPYPVSFFPTRTPQPWAQY